MDRMSSMTSRTWSTKPRCRNGTHCHYYQQGRCWFSHMPETLGSYSKIAQKMIEMKNEFASLKQTLLTAIKDQRQHCHCMKYGSPRDSTPELQRKERDNQQAAPLRQQHGVCEWNLIPERDNQETAPLRQQHEICEWNLVPEREKQEEALLRQQHEICEWNLVPERDKQEEALLRKQHEICEWNFVPERDKQEEALLRQQHEICEWNSGPQRDNQETALLRQKHGICDWNLDPERDNQETALLRQQHEICERKELQDIKLISPKECSFKFDPWPPDRVPGVLRQASDNIKKKKRKRKKKKTGV